MDSASEPVNMLEKLFGSQTAKIVDAVPWRGRLKIKTAVLKPWTTKDETFTMSVIVDKSRDPGTAEEVLLVSLMVS